MHHKSPARMGASTTIAIGTPARVPPGLAGAALPQTKSIGLDGDAVSPGTLAVCAREICQ
jgi:hypothetical protein